MEVVSENGFDGWFAGLGARLLQDGRVSGGQFALVEHRLAERALGAPMHRHAREDETSVVLEGRVAVQLGETVHEVGPGAVIHKPRGQWHTFWNAGETPARFLEIIAPAGFEAYFARLLALGGPEAATPGALCAIAAEFALEVDPMSIEDLARRHGLAVAA
jgi:quercetin dioxygenase-like cupin family protein